MYEKSLPTQQKLFSNSSDILKYCSYTEVVNWVKPESPLREKQKPRVILKAYI